MKKHLLFLGFTLFFTYQAAAVPLPKGTDVYLTLKGSCQELSEIAIRLESTLNKKVESSLDDVAFQNTLKEATLPEDLQKLKQASRCILDISTPEVLEEFKPPKESTQPLPRPKISSPFSASENPELFNDPYYRKQKFLDRIDAESAYRILLNDPEFLKSPAKIGIIDEGFANDRHEDLIGQIAAGSDVSNSNNDKHGQYVLGVMAAKAENSRGIVGVAGINTQFYYRTMTYVNGNVDLAHVANSIRELGRLGVDAINLSIGIQRECTVRVDGVETCHHPIVANSTIRLAIQETAKQYGTIFSLGAANDSQPVPHYVSPDEGILVVGTSTTGGSLTDYSNYGAGVDLYIPETGIYGLTKNGYSSSEIGTSFAAPVVTSIAALTKHYFESHGVHLSPGEIVRHILRNSTLRSGLTRNGSSGREVNMGKVLVNAHNIESSRR